MKRLGLLLSVLVLGGLLTAPPAQAAPAPLGPLLYAQGSSVYRSSLDLSTLTKIVDEPAGTTVLALASSADGSRFAELLDDHAQFKVIVRQADGTLYRVLADTSHVDNLPRAQRYASVAINHDGSRVAYSYLGDQGGAACWVETAANAPANRVREGALCGYTGFVYDPVGGPGDTGYLIDPYGTLRHGQIHNNYLPQRVTGVETDVHEVAVSPDGTRLAWTPQVVHGAVAIYGGTVSGPGVTGVQQLVESASSEQTDPSPAFSPDGSRVYFHQSTRSVTTHDDLDIDYVAFAGGAAVAVTDTPAVDEGPVQPMVPVVPGPVPTPPVAQPAVLGGTRAIVRWTSTTADVSSTLIRRTSPGQPTVTTESLGYAVSWANDGLVLGHDYTYALQTRDHFGQLSDPTTRTLTAIAPTVSGPDPSTNASAGESFTLSLPALGTHTLRQGTNNAYDRFPYGPTDATDTARTFPGIRGRSYHFYITVKDSYGNSSDETHAATVVVPLDQNAATYTGATAPQALPGQYRGSARVLRAAGATAKVAVQGDRFQLIGDRCASCGVFDVYVDGKRLVGVDTRNAAHQVRQVLVSIRLTGASSVVIKARGTAGRPNVVIDGFAVRH